MAPFLSSVHLVSQFVVVDSFPSSLPLSWTPSATHCFQVIVCVSDCLVVMALFRYTTNISHFVSAFPLMYCLSKYHVPEPRRAEPAFHLPISPFPLYRHNNLRDIFFICFSFPLCVSVYVPLCFFSIRLFPLHPTNHFRHFL